jgi:hypothetical protein
VARCQDLEATVVIGSAQDRRHTRLASC